ncbi:MAG TPA: hypothetical protein VF432_21745 [Thermoanaerobaculia bacterium]
MGQGYQIDVLNNTSRSLAISPGPSANMSANSLPTLTLTPNQWLSSNNQNQPYYVELDGSDTGFVTIAVSAGSVTSSGSVRVEFDTATLQNFPATICFASAGDLTPIPVVNGTSVDYIYATLYLSIWGEWTAGMVVLFEATGASSQISPPF